LPVINAAIRGYRGISAVPCSPDGEAGDLVANPLCSLLLSILSGI